VYTGGNLPASITVIVMDNYIDALVKRHITDVRPWDRLPHEPSDSFAVFAALREMPPDDRVIADAVKKVTGISSEAIPSKYYKYQAKYKWEERLWAFDVYQDQKAQEVWVERRKEEREREWHLAHSMVEVARAMLERATNDLDGVSWRASDIPKLVETASKLARLAAQMELSSTKISVEQINSELGDALQEYYIALEMAGQLEDVVQDAEFRALIPGAEAPDGSGVEEEDGGIGRDDEP
jgi:hypothetical protein